MLYFLFIIMYLDHRMGRGSGAQDRLNQRVNDMRSRHDAMFGNGM